MRLILIVLLGCASIPQDEKTILAQEVHDEVEVGRNIAAKILGQLGWDQAHPELTRYVSLLGHYIANSSSRPEITYHFSILKSDEVNAFATPGGFIFVTQGLLHAVHSEDELACVLGHEIAHITEKHLYNQIKPKHTNAVADTLTRFLSRGGSSIGASMLTLVHAGLKALLEDGLGKEKEYAADEIGVTIASAAGYNPQSMIQLLTRIHKLGKHIGKTHPPYPERIQALELSMKKMAFVLYPIITGPRHASHVP